MNRIIPFSAQQAMIASLMLCGTAEYRLSFAVLFGGYGESRSFFCRLSNGAHGFIKAAVRRVAAQAQQVR